MEIDKKQVGEFIIRISSEISERKAKIKELEIYLEALTKLHEGLN